TASSTRAVISRGVETATSTPQLSVNSHSLRGLFTRATVRRTANSVLARNETTRLTLSSPEAQTTWSYPASPAWSRVLISQASPMIHSAAGTVRVRASSASRSMMRTSCPLPMSSRAMERPTLPAPMTATLICSLLRRCAVETVLQPGQLLAQCHEVDLVPVLVHRVPVRDERVPETGDEGDPGAGVLLQVGEPSAHPGLVEVDPGQR